MNMDAGKTLEGVGKVGFVGAGNMAQAIGGALLRTGLLKASNIYVSSPSNTNKGPWIQFGTHTTTENGCVVENSDVIFLAMKPIYLDAALMDIKNTLKQPVSNKLFVSLLAGVPLKVLEEKIHRIVPDARVIRVMPNTPVLVGAGCSVFSCGTTATKKDAEVVKMMLSTGGICQEISESLIDAAGGLSGCGPAYVYLIIEALSDGAVKMGVPRAMATQFASQTVLGAAKMVLETGKHPGQLKDEVCSPGGTTICGIHALEKGGVRSTLMEAVEAATKRAAELGKNK
ncbi:pyrroline-5-carboxylate reductase-like isoform X3 [Schistocerca americana]|nr:pyrroline-5-carboxylate reductase-like isoform X3 [Schistocerca americana]